MFWNLSSPLNFTRACLQRKTTEIVMVELPFRDSLFLKKSDLILEQSLLFQIRVTILERNPLFQERVHMGSYFTVINRII